MCARLPPPVALLRRRAKGALDHLSFTKFLHSFVKRFGVGAIALTQFAWFLPDSRIVPIARSTNPHT
jgi:hypothetical protein